MRHILLPITALSLYFLIYLAIYSGFYAAAWFFNLSWFWIILVTVLLSSLILGLMSILIELPGLICALILKFYNYSWVSVIVHVLAGLAAIIEIINVFFFVKVSIGGGGTASSFITGLWEYSHLRTILFSLFIVPFFLSFIAFVFVPFSVKLDLKDQTNDGRNIY